MDHPAAAPKHFYYQINGSVIGPVTGIELRNAALAGNVVPNTLLANDPNGEWVLAKFAQGLFDEGGTPLPHPPETNQLLEGSQVDARVEQRATTDSTPISGFSERPTQFYFKHEGNVIGPMTGAELWESAFVGNVVPTTLVATDPNGEWVAAHRVRGLFDESGRPLPHPLGSQQYRSLGGSTHAPITLVGSASSEREPRHSRSASEWYVQFGNRQIGPLTEHQLRQMARDGRLRNTDLVTAGPIHEWTEARHVAGLDFAPSGLAESAPGPPSCAHPAGSASPTGRSVPPLPRATLPSHSIQNSPRPSLHSQPLSTWFAWVVWPMAFFGMFAAYLLAAYAEHTQNVLLYIIGSLSLSLTLGLHAAYLTWLILDVGILSTTITRLAVRSPVKLHFSPVWGIPIAGLCCPGVLLLPLSVIHLLHDRKKVIKQLTERASDRAVPWFAF